MQFYFIRHGQSVNNYLYTTFGSNSERDCDPELTKAGRRQVELLADYLYDGEINLTHLYTSLMVRAVSTGQVVADRLGLPLVAWPDLHEEGGIYLDDEQDYPVGQPGKDRAYFEQNFPNLVLPDSLNASGWWNRPYEAATERPVRAQRALRDLITRHGGTNHCVGVISHGGFYNHFLSAIFNYSNNPPLWFVLQNTAITRLDFLSDRTDFVYHNRVSFLPDELIT
jgi:2,3-bisphosphoglycerate-dependent phosphoglycerate mutase